MSEAVLKAGAMLSEQSMKWNIDQHSVKFQGLVINFNCRFYTMSLMHDAGLLVQLTRVRYN